MSNTNENSGDLLRQYRAATGENEKTSIVEKLHVLASSRGHDIMRLQDLIMEIAQQESEHARSAVLVKALVLLAGDRPHLS